MKALLPRGLLRKWGKYYLQALKRQAGTLPLRYALTCHSVFIITHLSRLWGQGDLVNNHLRSNESAQR